MFLTESGDPEGVEYSTWCERHYDKQHYCRPRAIVSCTRVDL